MPCSVLQSQLMKFDFGLAHFLKKRKLFNYLNKIHLLKQFQDQIFDFI